MTEKQTTGFRPTGTPDQRVDAVDFAMLDPREQLRVMLRDHVVGKPFSELNAVTFDHRAAAVMGHVMLDTLEDAGYSVDDFDAVGALTAAAVPLVSAMIQAAASRGEDLDGFVMDFVYPSIKGPSIEGRRVVLVDAWLSEKSYVQTSSLVTLRNGNELSLDFGVVEAQGAQVVAITSLVGGVGETGESAGSASGNAVIEVINPATDEQRSLPFVPVFDESELNA
ncbi:Orotate phosphoribosyltransferase [Bifidobacterium lemurum]|uniref:Orotate phosphoribosyltransferase n=1 Tax=Bifidobacterium lemurum TaxID=1603886 RepID=A0A261FRT9_9BIFI|nr:orotate phosphoribosyltransferase [Bifidobacterium lemurum]OZG61904.1 Orotate phosphoribosyltransferase [Bifidobacterium lemurum]QOL33301.1 orotate phosphoribosyltransferase [Bifidobacterium lemurum]